MDYELIIGKYYKDAPALEKPSGAILKRITRIGLPGAFAMLNETAAFALIAIIVSPLGVTSVGGHQIAINVSAFVWMCPFSIGAEGYPRHARVCERHTGAGLSAAEIEAQNLPLPHADLLPETLEEKVICYADKFFSKTKLDREKTLEQAERSVAKHGGEGLARFKEMEKLFE